METYQYTAFISYRHTMPDEAVAKKLHRSELPCTAFSNDGSKVLCDTYSTSPAILTTPEGAAPKIVDQYGGLNEENNRTGESAIQA